MVKIFFLLAFTLILGQVCIGQNESSMNHGRLDAIFSLDTISHGELEDLCLKISNNTNEILYLYTSAYLALHHFNKDNFVSYDNPERISYPISFPDSIEDVLILSPKESFHWKQSVLIDTTFFDIGENKLVVIFNSDSYKRKLKVDKNISFVGSIESTVINLFIVNTCSVPNANSSLIDKQKRKDR